MKDRRLGEHLWTPWEGEGLDGDLIYYTPEDVDMEEEIVRRALASALQRDGVADSLFDGFIIISKGEEVKGWMGVLPGEKNFVVCDEQGETFYGELVEEALPCTWILVDS
jgi:hypothetical protein